MFGTERLEDLVELKNVIVVITKGALQNEQLFKELIPYVKENINCFQMEPFRSCGTIWYHAAKYVEEFDKQPTIDELIILIQGRKARAVNPAIYEEALEILQDAKESSNNPVEVSLSFARKKLSYLFEKYYQGLVGFHLQHKVNGKVGELERLFESIRPQYLRAISPDVTDVVQSQSVSLDFFSDSVVRFPYNVEFVDYLLNGGSEHPEVSIFIAPTGVGKTFFALQLCTQWAISNPPEDHVCVYVSYELPRKQFLKRIYMQLCRISEAEFKQMVRLGEKNLTEEQRRRWKFAQEIYQRHIRTIDFSGFLHKDNDSPLIGAKATGKFEDMIRSLDAIVDGRTELLNLDSAEEHINVDLPKRKIHFVVIDWLGAAVEAEMTGLRTDLRSEPSLMVKLHQQYICKVLREIATPYDCAVWVVHQQAGSKEKRTAGALPHHSEASWSKNLGQFAYNAFSLTHKNKDGVQVLATSKVRSGEQKPPIPIKFNPETSLFERVDKEICMDFDRLSVAFVNKGGNKDGNS